MRFDAKRLKTFLLYGANDSTGEGRWTYEAYALGEERGAFIEDSKRRALTLDRYEIRLKGIRKHKPGLTLATT
jgi:hypothetical protein